MYNVYQKGSLPAIFCQGWPSKQHRDLFFACCNRAKQEYAISGPMIINKKNALLLVNYIS